MNDHYRFGEAFVRDAGVMLMDRFGRTTATAKGPFDVVTEADHEIEHAFIDRLKEACPDHQFLGEETVAGADGGLREWCWVLDPLDGTVNFAYHLPGFCVSLALLHHGEPVEGWVFDPLHDELYHASSGARPTLNGEALPAMPDDPDEALPIGISTGLLKLPGFDAAPLLQHYGKTRIVGSQALHLCYVAAGRMRAALNPEAKLWDDAAGALIVRAAGGRYGTLSGREVFPLRPGAEALTGSPIGSLAADPEAFADLVRLLN